MVQTKEQYRLVYSTLAKIFHGYLDSMKRELLVDLETADDDAVADGETHDYENWKPLGDPRQQQPAVNSYENIIPALLMNQEKAAEAAAAEMHRQRKLNNGRYDRKQQLLQQQHPLHRANATRHHAAVDDVAHSTNLEPNGPQKPPSLPVCDTLLAGASSNSSSTLVLPNIPSLSLTGGGGGGGNGSRSHHGSRTSLVSPASQGGCGISSSSPLSPSESKLDAVESSASSSASPNVGASPASMSRSVALSNLLSTEALDSNLLGLRRSPPLNFSSLENSKGAAGARGSASPSPLVAKSPTSTLKANGQNDDVSAAKSAAVAATSPTSGQEDSGKSTQSAAEALSGLDELDALINAEMESVRHMQVLLNQELPFILLHLFLLFDFFFFFFLIVYIHIFPIPSLFCCHTPSPIHLFPRS